MMNSLTNITNIQYKNILPEPQRRQARKFLLALLRQCGAYFSLNRLGVRICRDYIQINSDSIHDLGFNHEMTMDVEMTREVQELKAAKHIPSQICEDLDVGTVEIDTAILRIADPTFRLSNHHLVDPYHNILGSYNTPFGTLPISKQFLERTVHCPKTVAYLSDPEPTNYYHWMCGTLPLLRFYQNLPDAIDLYYIGSFSLQGFHLESLARAGIAPTQLLQQASTADRIVAAMSSRFVRLNDPISQKAYKFSRTLFSDVIAPATQNPATRIYVQRGDTARRRVINESEVITLLEENGFTCVQMDGKSIQEQATIFASAEVIIAPHGAALTNLLFIQPGTKVIEIFPNGYINNCFFTLANYSEADYYYLLGEPTQQLSNNSHSLDIHVDIHKLSQICQMATIHRSDQ